MIDHNKLSRQTGKCDTTDLCAVGISADRESVALHGCAGPTTTSRIALRSFDSAAPESGGCSAEDDAEAIYVRHGMRGTECLACLQAPLLTEKLSQELRSMRYGLDFGTSNSAIAVYRDSKVELLPVDPLADGSRMVPTLLYINRDKTSYIGYEAIAKYVEGNVGREVRKERVETDFVVHDVYGTKKVWVEAEINMPGRFFQVMKSFLKDKYFYGTDVFGKFYTIEELVAEFLRHAKTRADRMLGENVRAVTLGRPVKFSDNADEDSLAEKRLREAARLAGFSDISFLFEPIGAALNYSRRLVAAEKVLVFDFGGGTLDFCIVQLEPYDLERLPRPQILSTSGLLIGGNTLNEEIMEVRLIKHFGSELKYRMGPSEPKMPMPRHIYAELRYWYNIAQLNERELITFLQDVRLRNPSRQIEALICLITKNYGWGLFQEIERAKRELTDSLLTEIRFQADVISVVERIKRREFESIIRNHLMKIDAALDKLINQAGLEPDQIDAVLATGGSSLIPAVQELLESKFGRARVLKQNAFTSVVSGLAVST